MSAAATAIVTAQATTASVAHAAPNAMQAPPKIMDAISRDTVSRVRKRTILRVIGDFDNTFLLDLINLIKSNKPVERSNAVPYPRMRFL